MRYLYIYLLIINLTAFVTYLADKRKAVKDRWRVKESTLLILAAIGGSAGALLAMLMVRHKTKKAKFMISVPVMLMLQIIFCTWLSFRLGASMYV